MHGATVPSGWDAKRADARYCASACRQRAFRSRTEDSAALAQEIEVQRRRYWALVAKFAVVRGESQANVTVSPGPAREAEN